MMENLIKQLIPASISEFPKITSGHEPYCFDRWDQQDGVAVLRYWFWNRTKTRKNKKRVFVDEMVYLLQHSTGDVVSRKDFNRFCRRTNRDGPCGFAVICGILQHLGVGTTVRGGFRITDRDRIGALLNQTDCEQ